MTYQNPNEKTDKDCQAGCDLFAGYISSACIQDCKEKYEKHSSDSFEQNKQSKLLEQINFQE
jgi:hypothetical protein